jgi:hypothetical protein
VCRVGYDGHLADDSEAPREIGHDTVAGKNEFHVRVCRVHCLPTNWAVAGRFHDISITATILGSKDDLAQTR